MLMLTVSLQGMHTVYGDVEMCWWALTSKGASYNASAGADGRWLIGTGMEDFVRCIACMLYRVLSHITTHTRVCTDRQRQQRLTQRDAP
jgi:hypothetical protein